MSKLIFVLGSGGHAKVVLATLQACGQVVAGVLDINSSRIGEKLLGVEIFDQEIQLNKYRPSDVLLLNGIGSISLPYVREKIFSQFKARGYTFLTLVHPTAYIGPAVILGEGCQIMAGAIIQPDCRIGENVVINTRVSIDHDCRIDDHVHLGPGTTLSGHVHVETLCHLGTGSIVIQNIHIVAKTLVAAGAVVIHSVQKPGLVVGVPGKIKTCILE